MIVFTYDPPRDDEVPTNVGYRTMAALRERINRSPKS